MQYIEKPELDPSGACFENTDVPKLSLETDAALLEVITPVGIVVDQPFIESLNTFVDQSIGGDATKRAYDARRAVTQQNLPFRKPGLALIPATMSNTRSMAYNGFYNLLQVIKPDSPLNPISQRVRDSRSALPTLVGNLRLLHKYSQDALPVVLESIGNTIALRTSTLERKFALLESEGISVHKVLLHSPHVLSSKDLGANQEKFLKQARNVGSRQSPGTLTKLARAARLGVESSVVDRPGAKQVSPEMQTRYRDVAQKVGLTSLLLMEGLPQLEAMDDERLQAFSAAVDELLDTKDDIKLRDLLKLVD